MRPFLLHIICIVMLFSSCNWVNDDLSDCPTGTWLKISYTYNILDVDAASSQVGDITIFAFDKNNKYVDRLDVDSIALHQGYCMVRVPFPEGSYVGRSLRPSIPVPLSQNRSDGTEIIAPFIDMQQ